jgi:hypothetical protein
MKIRTLLITIGWSCALSVGAQNYSIDWHTMDGGGGTSTGGLFSVSGTIGQPDTGVMSGGDYTVTGGYWSLFAVVQIPGAPWLSIELTDANTLMISWPAPSTGFELEHNGSVNTISWQKVGIPPSVVGDRNQVIMALPAGPRFYRLCNP